MGLHPFCLLEPVLTRLNINTMGFAIDFERWLGSKGLEVLART